MFEAAHNQTKMALNKRAKSLETHLGALEQSLCAKLTEAEAQRRVQYLKRARLQRGQGNETRGSKYDESSCTHTDKQTQTLITLRCRFT